MTGPLRVLPRKEAEFEFCATTAWANALSITRGELAVREYFFLLPPFKPHEVRGGFCWTGGLAVNPQRKSETVAPINLACV